MSKDANEEKGRGAHEPWSNKERNIILQHVLNHVLANAGYANIFTELIDVLVKEGCPLRTTSQLTQQWRRKICKDLLAIYGPGTPDSLDTSSQHGSPAKGPSCPSKRKRNGNVD